MSRLCLLVVDDCKDTADTTAILLRLWGHDVHVAYGSEAALQLADGVRPDVILIDLGMPGMDGYSLARELRQRMNCSNVRIVAITGFGDKDHRSRGEQAGFDEYLVKPVELHVLQGVLDRFACPGCCPGSSPGVT